MPTRDGLYSAVMRYNRPRTDKLFIYRANDEYVPVGFGHAVLLPHWEFACRYDTGHEAHCTHPGWPWTTWDAAFTAATEHALVCHGVTL